jgi:hypothetical protein
MVDQWRGDCLSIAGHPVVHTPYLDQLALDGARFTRAYSATPTCIPARAGLFTGQAQRTHGRVGYQDGVPWDYPVTLAGEFTRGGYQTQAVGKMHVYPERSQMGFQNVILHDGFLHFARKRGRSYDLVDDYNPWLREQLGRDADYFDHGVNCNSYVARPWDKPEHLHPTNFVVTQSLDFLRRRDPRKPFFLFMSFHRPHPPYDPPVWAYEMYCDQPMPDVPVGDWMDLLAEYDNPSRPDCFRGALDPRAHGAKKTGQVYHFRLDGCVFDGRHAVGQAGGHKDVLGASMAGIVQDQALGLEPRRFHHIVGAFDGHFAAHFLKALQVYTHWARADGAAPWVRRLGLAKASQQWPYDQKTGAHFGSQIQR